MRYHQTEENRAALGLANRLLDEPNADPDDDLHLLSRQLLRMDESITRLLADLKTYDRAAETTPGCSGDVSGPSLNAEIERLKTALHETQLEHEDAERRFREARDAADTFSQTPVFIRCVEHISVAQQNTNEATGSECGACIAAERDELIRAFDKAGKALGTCEDWIATPREDLLANAIAALRAENAQLKAKLGEG